ncbi:hypothetical protein BpHYR1_001388 [Brachionus plicatilis]|uniref:Uncharacterized protein n=1 Tax=Brachionus plicatilis TaxID=10195 RepID=A0A3M7QGE5_BRAPC|nr:hypothetical protein BpHYR1_001388 [Brachionus plicatilis]
MVNFGIGGYHYFCASKVIEMGLKTEGIFLLSDDVLLKFWNLNNLDTKKVWFPTDLILNIKMRPNEVKNWMHWPNINKIIKMWSDFDVVLQKSKNSKEIKYIKNRIENITKVKYCGSDFFYLPSDKFEIGYYFLNKFRKYDVFLELAVPIVLAGIESNKTLQIMNGHYEWGGAPLRFHQMYSKINFFHPFKLSKLKQKETASNYCLYFVNDYINDSFQMFRKIRNNEMFRLYVYVISAICSQNFIYYQREALKIFETQEISSFVKCRCNIILLTYFSVALILQHYRNVTTMFNLNIN